MGRSDPHLVAFYKPHFKLKGDVALLGEHDASSALSGDVFGLRTLLGEGNAFRTHHGDLYDLQLGNWNINSDWSLEKKYDTIICTRCPYFAKDPEDFIERNRHPTYRYIDWDALFAEVSQKYDGVFYSLERFGPAVIAYFKPVMSKELVS